MTSALATSRRPSRRAIILGLGMIGCSSLLDPGRPDISLSFMMQQALVLEPMLQANIGGTNVELRLAPNGEVQTARLRGPRYGQVPVGIALVDPSGDTLAAVTFTEEYRRGYQHGIGGTVSRHRPIGTCVGTMVVAPLTSSPSDTLFVSYIGIPKDAIC